MDMKRIASAATIAALFTALTGAIAYAQNAPLGDYARQARKQKQQAAPPAKTYDNDTLPHDDKLSVVGQAPATPDTNAPVNSEAATAAGNSGAAAASDQKPADTNPASGEEKNPADAQAEKQKMFKDWQTKIAAQQAKIDELAKDLDLTTREYRLRAAAFYADAGNRLRNAGQWDKEDAQFKDQIADKQKKLDDAKQALEDLREQARKAGVPSSMRE
jgi:hypothetical protein